MAELTPEEKQKIYAEEKTRLEAQESLKLEAKKKAAQKKNKDTLIGLAVIAVLAVILWQSHLFDFFSSSHSSTTSAAVPSTPVATLAARELYKNYQANEVAADATYKGKTIIVVGLVESIGKDILGTPYLALWTGDSIGTVQCMFSSDHQNELSQIKKGQSVNIKGECSGKLINVILRGCSLQ